jgi:cytochrome c-type biogenesis protein CcmE
MSESSIALGPPRRLPARPPSRTRNAQILIAALVVVAAIGYLIYNGFQSASVYYLTVGELKAKAAGPAGMFAPAVRVAGVVQAGSVQRSDTDSTVRFTIADGGGSLPVVYKGMVPDIFGPGIQVVVEGHYVNGEFQATTLLAKCPSKFTAAVPTPIAAR